jgi:uncharacterized membrane protein (DUF373 family)
VTERSRPDEEDDEPPRYVRIGNALLAITEDVIYVGIAAVLAVAAVALLVSAVRGLTQLSDTGASDVVIEVLDRLLLVFIVVELLFAVRVILGKREVVAEPFLIVGIIASIKEIIVLSVKAADYVGKDDKFMHSIIEVGVLGLLVLSLAFAAIILRAKEREPQEGRADAGRESRKDGEALKIHQGDPHADDA